MYSGDSELSSAELLGSVRVIHGSWFAVPVADDDHTLHDCIAVGVLSHGAHSGQVYGADGELISVDVLLAPLKHCLSLVGKPKIVIIEVCLISREHHMHLQHIVRVS